MDLVTVLKAFRGVVRARRALRGPRLPSWSADFETWAAVLHHYTRRSTRLPLAWQRRVLDLAPRPISSVSFRRVSAGGVPGAWLRPPGADPARVLLYLHGGGYSIGSIDSHRHFIGLLAEATATNTLAIDYRLAPEFPFPAQLDDALAVYAWLLAEGFAPERVALAGESAGGALTLSTMIALRDRELPLPAAALCISPWIDLEAASPSVRANERFDYLSAPVLHAFRRRFVTDAEVRHPLAAPIHAELHGLPPLHIQVGTAEALYDDATRLADRARAAGVEVSLDVGADMIHAYPLFANVFPECRPAVEDAARFLRERLA